MPEQEKSKNSGMKAIMQEQRNQRGVSLLEQGKRTKGARIIFSSDADRNLDGVRYRLGDMVWAKVKSHPWWPGQLYDPKLASASAMELKRDSCFLVAFFGDSTFGWFAEAELIPFAPNFAKKSKQTTSPSFVDAVEDALDEVQRRVKAGLTCGCCISDSTSGEGRQPGLLYDRQLHDIRNTFQPVTLLTSMKDLACSPLSSSQDTLETIIARAQAAAFRLKAKKALEMQVLGGLIPNNQFKAQVSGSVGIPERSKDCDMAEKSIKKKHVSSVQRLTQERKELKSTNEKIGGLHKLGEMKHHSTSSSPKKEKCKVSHGEKGGAKVTSLKNKNPQCAENVVQDSGTMDATVSLKILASVDGFKERGIGGSGLNTEVPEIYNTGSVSEGGIRNATSLIDRGSLALQQEKEFPKAKPKKNLAGPTNDKIVSKVDSMDAIELQAFPEKPMAVAMKVKAVNIDVGQASKRKAVKKVKAVTVEVDQVAKNAKVASVDMDWVSTAKRMAEHDTTESINAASTKAKKRKVSARSVCNDKFDDSLKLVVEASDHSLQEPAEEVMSDLTGLASGSKEPHTLPLVSMEVTEYVSATPILELDSEFNRLQQEEALQETPDDNDALAPLVAGQLQGNQAEADHRAVLSLQISKERKKKLRDSKTFEPLKPEGDGALVPLVTKAKLLKQAEQLEMPASNLQVKSSTDLVTKKKKTKNKSSVQPLKSDGDDAFVLLVEHPQKGDHLGAEYTTESSLQAKNFMDISNNKRHLKDSVTFEPLSSEGNSDSLAIRDGEEYAKSMETCSKVTDNQTFKKKDPSSLEVDSRLMDSVDICSSHVSCGAVEDLQGISQKKKESLTIKYGQEEKKTMKKEVKDSKTSPPPPDKVNVSRKRDFEGEGHISKDFRAWNKKEKIVVMEGPPEFCEAFHSEDGAEQHEDQIKKRKGSAHFWDLREGLLSVAAKPLDSIKEEFYSAVHTAFLNFRKAVYQGPEVSLAPVGDADAAVLGASNRTGLLESAREQTSSERSSQSFEVEGLKDDRIEKGGGEVLGGGKQSQEDKIDTSSKPQKKSVSKKVSSSSISLRPAIDVTIPVRGSKEILNRLGQRTPRLSDEAENAGNHPPRLKNAAAAAERALMISFPQGFPLPSELQLREAFAKFGDLNLPLTKIDSRSGCARIIFRCTQDAEAALRSMKEHPVYENTHFWLKPRDADVGELSKQSSKYTSSAERLALSQGYHKPEAKSASGIRTALDKRVPMSTENHIASDRCRLIEDRSGMPQNSSSSKAGASGKGVYVSLQSNCGGMNEQPSPRGCASENAPIGNAVGSNAGASGKGPCASSQLTCGVMNALPSVRASARISVGSNTGHESMEGIVTISHFKEAASSSSLPHLRHGSLHKSPSEDISESFLALLHQCHGLVKSMGFTF